MNRKVALALLAPLLMSGLLSGCGIKLAYNNLDRIAGWTANDYIDMDARQKAYFKAELAVVLYWHRTTELPIYAAALRRFDADVADGLTMEELLAMEERVLDASHRMRGAFAPMAAEILYSTTPAQRVDMKRRFDRENRNYLEPLEDLDLEGQQERWGRDFEDAFEFFVGRASDAQSARIVRTAAEFQPEDQMWVEYRERWRNQLFALLDDKPAYSDFLLQMREMIGIRERFYGEAYDEMMERNERLYRDLSIDLVNSLTDKQRRKLSGRFLGWAEAFDELVQEAPAEPPQAACMAGCLTTASGYSSRINQAIR